MTDMILQRFVSVLSGLTLSAQLENVFREYGVHLATTSYFVSYDQQKIKGMFDRIRELGGEKGYPLKCASFPIKNIRDLTTGQSTEEISVRTFDLSLVTA